MLNIWAENQCLHAEILTPLEQRLATEKPQLLSGLEKLKSLLGREKFEQHISPLQNLAKNNTDLLLVTGSAQARTRIVAECLPALKEAFSVQTIHVIAK